MKGILIRIKPGHVIDGEGEFLGKDSEGNPHTFWRSSGEMEVPLDLALKLLKEKPQRFELVNKGILKDLTGEIPKEIIDMEGKPAEPTKMDITMEEIKKMTKDEINDWAAKSDYDVTTSDNKPVMIKKLVEQIEKRTGEKVQ